MCNLPQLRTKTTFLSGCNVLDPKSPCIKLIVNNAITLKSSNLEFFKTFEISTDNAVPHQSRDICVRVKIVTYFWLFIINFLNARLCASKVHRWCHGGLGKRFDNLCGIFTRVTHVSPCWLMRIRTLIQLVCLLI